MDVNNCKVLGENTRKHFRVMRVLINEDCDIGRVHPFLQFLGSIRIGVHSKPEVSTASAVFHELKNPLELSCG